MAEWKFVGAAYEPQRFEIEGIDVWQHEWRPRQKETVTVKEPSLVNLFRRKHEAYVYEISDGDKRVVFAACEFSNCCFGFYIPQEV